MGRDELVEEVEGGFGADFDFVEVFLAAKVLLVAIELPTGDVLGEEAGMAELVEFGDDGFVPMAVVEHGVDEVAQVFGKGSDFAGQAAI